MITCLQVRCLSLQKAAAVGTRKKQPLLFRLPEDCGRLLRIGKHAAGRLKLTFDIETTTKILMEYRHESIDS